MKHIKIAPKDLNIVLRSTSAVNIVKMYVYYSDRIETRENIVINNQLPMINDGIVEIDISYEGGLITYELIEDLSNTFYSCIFSGKIISDNFGITLDISNSETANVSANVTISVDGRTVNYDIPIYGEYIASSTRPGNSIVFDDKIIEISTFDGRKYYSYKVKDFNFYEDGLSISNNTVKYHSESLFNVSVEIRIFSIDKKLNTKPIIKNVGLKKYV